VNPIRRATILVTEPERGHSQQPLTSGYAVGAAWYAGMSFIVMIPIIVIAISGRGDLTLIDSEERP
jgi:hypothetical protein